MKFRLLNKLYAHLFGYFWLPCPLCGQMFGGHEWKRGHLIRITQYNSKGICKDCGDMIIK